METERKNKDKISLLLGNRWVVFFLGPIVFFYVILLTRMYNISGSEKEKNGHDSRIVLISFLGTLFYLLLGYAIFKLMKWN